MNMKKFLNHVSLCLCEIIHWQVDKLFIEYRQWEVMGLEVLTTCLFPRNSVRVCLSIAGCPHIAGNAWLNTRSFSHGKNKLIWKRSHVIIFSWNDESLSILINGMSCLGVHHLLLAWIAFSVWISSQEIVEQSDNLWRTAENCQSSYTLIPPTSIFTCKDYAECT